MSQLQHLDELPPNFPDFANEVADAMETMYGPEAAAHYRGAAEAQFRGAIQHPSVDMLGCYEGKRALALLVTIQRGMVTQFSFLHVLEDALGRGIEQRLVAEAVRIHRAGGVDAILAEYVQFASLDDREVYESLGFETIQRELMIATLPNPQLTREAPPASVEFSQDDWGDAAEVIVAAYDGHPGRRLHIEVRDFENALAFVQAVSESSYGPSRPEYRRRMRQNGVTEGVIVGCEVAPRIGFILQVAVRPEYQDRGIGGRLVSELSQALEAAGCAQVALGVTSDSPARRLYSRLGFRTLRDVPAHVWWRP
ncbi:MAG: GNAT family N-acetyltransferase [Candidatus Hydrogenedentes bacterium]|nr:GNAT family N-acetyltransferase [Candidatus Hydrogenedentota bacterium]